MMTTDARMGRIAAQTGRDPPGLHRRIGATYRKILALALHQFRIRR